MTLVLYRSRAKRRQLECPVDFRVTEYQTWQQGRLKNISESGLLFDAGFAIEPGETVDIRISFPLPGTVALSCNAVAVRTDAETCLVGARIVDYQLKPQAN